MYADRYARPGGINPGSLGIALGINAVVIAALMFSSPEFRRHMPDPPIKMVDVLDPPPPDPIKPDPPRTKPQPTQPVQHIDTVTPIVDVVRPDADVVLPPQPPVTIDTNAGEGAGTVIAPPKPLPPVMVQPGIDQRYAGAFQPPYPPAEQRAGRNGRVTLRVLIGVDGRVKEVQTVTATSDEFLRVTQQRALQRWRFTPATRDGIPVEAWKTMNVTFVLQDN